MPEFIMEGRDDAANDLDAFTLGYVEALFFTETETGTDPETHDPENESALHGECGFDDFAPETLDAIKADCARFQKDNADLLAIAYQRDGYSAERAGNDFWFTRNGHGVGYWDRKELEPVGEEWERVNVRIDLRTPEMSQTHYRMKQESIGERLSRACGFQTDFPNVDVYLGDDGKIYL